MKRHLYILLAILLSACGPNTVEQNNTAIPSGKADTIIPVQSTAPQVNPNVADTGDVNYATYFVVVADTGRDYSVLHRKMLDLNKTFHIPIDTMGRSYNKTKDLIALPDNDEDEIYAGEYFPRRYPSESLSLEYLDIYQKEAGKKTIALLRGIYETESGADKALTEIKQTEKKAFAIKAYIYVGCMH